MQEISTPRERAILVALGSQYAVQPDGRDPLAELRRLADTAGAEVVGTLVQARDNIEPRYYIGTGKAEELKELVATLEATTVIFDHNLAPAQASNLSELLNVKVIDRSGLILDIFALHARTSEARTQVELAQLKHLLPRLTRQWTHLSRQVGGIGVRGPGETQLEVDRRRIRARVETLSADLKLIERRGEISRHQRKERCTVTLVGYTNAGKSSLFNTLSRGDALVEDKLFKTLDSLTRELRLPLTPVVLLTDTVGFIRNLPHELIASFRSTLSEVREADLLLHVVDATDPEHDAQRAVVDAVLADIGAEAVPRVTVFNKVDLLKDPHERDLLRLNHQGAHLVSAHSGEGVEMLTNAIARAALANHVVFTRPFGSHESALLAEVYQHGIIRDTTSEGENLTLTVALPKPVANRLGLPDKASVIAPDLS